MVVAQIPEFPAGNCSQEEECQANKHPLYEQGLSVRGTRREVLVKPGRRAKNSTCQRSAETLSKK